jgi:hypothetical protein
LNLPTKTGTIKTSKKRNLPRVIPAYQDSDRAHLSDRFAHQYARQCWTTGKMPRKKPFVTRQMPGSCGRYSGFDRSDLVNKQKGRTMGQNICG